jgi:hypothetical protein
MPRPSCQKNFQQITALAPEDVKIPSVRIALQSLLHLQGRLFMPRRMSVVPVASQTRTFDGGTIIRAAPL